MPRLLPLLSRLLPALAAAVLAPAAAPEDTPPEDALPPDAVHAIDGRVVDAAGRGVAGAAVSVCDAATGIPVDRSSRPFTEVEAAFDHDDPWRWTATDEEGRFRLEGLRPGRYRLVAQSWPAVPRPTGLLERNGATVHLRGAALVDVPLAGPVLLEPLGQGVLAWSYEAANDDGYLVMSRFAPLGDPVLGFVGWRGPFLEEALGFLRLPGGRGVVRGLPEGALGWAFFANDSRPGFASGSVRVRVTASSPVTHVSDPDVVAPWSDARRDPPPRLAPLVDWIATLEKEELWELLDYAPADRPARNPFADLLDRHGPLDRPFPLPAAAPGPATIGDVLAALAYAELRRSRERSR